MTGERWEYCTVRRVVVCTDNRYDLYFADGGGCTIPVYPGTPPCIGERVGMYLDANGTVLRCTIGEREVMTIYAERTAQGGASDDA